MTSRRTVTLATMLFDTTTGDVEAQSLGVCTDSTNQRAWAYQFSALVPLVWELSRVFWKPVASRRAGNSRLGVREDHRPGYQTLG